MWGIGIVNDLEVLVEVVNEQVLLRLNAGLDIFLAVFKSLKQASIVLLDASL